MTLPPLPIPEDVTGHFIPTLNGTGYALSKVDILSSRFIDYAASINARVLEIGSAYGVVTLSALERGIEVYCNDIEPMHLQFVKKSASNYDHLLTIVPGSFPDEINFHNNFFDAILISRVIHLFSGEVIEQSMRKIYQWLKPGGKVFIVADTPYLKNFSSFIPEYESRVNSGEKWPGFIEDLSKYSDERHKHLPKQAHVMDLNVMQRVLLESNFEIEDLKFQDRNDYPQDRRLDGRESICAIAKKPIA